MAKKNKRTVEYKGGGLIFSDFAQGLYLLDTPRTLNEQLTSLAMIGGRNCWAEKGALVPQYGYLTQAQIPQEDRVVGISKTSATSSDFYLITINGVIYFYTAYQGLKKFATKLDIVDDTLLIARKGYEVILRTGGANYLFGGLYQEASAVTIEENVTVQNFATYYEFTTSEDNIPYYWNNKRIAINDSQFTITSIIDNKDGTYKIRMVIDGGQQAYPDPVTISEKTLFPLTLSYQSEAESSEPISLTPQSFAVCGNRLYVVDVSGRIYYSQVGVVNGFNQAAGAGYFEDFYNDSSKVLAIEDFLNKALITTENGIYIATIGDTLSVEKISQVGQKYSGDHVIVGEKVYAFDSNSGSIVNAISVNVFGALVAGKTIIPSEYIDAENMGINSTKRKLVYNAESGVLILYYGERLNRGLVLTNANTLFPRELDLGVDDLIGFNQGVAFITDDNKICQDFKKGSIIPSITPIVEFEQIGLRSNKLLCAGVLEITELNGIDYTLTTSNEAYCTQKITPSFFAGISDEALPSLIYSDAIIQNPSYAEKSRWADKSSNATRVYSRMSGRSGISIGLEFPADIAFCVTAIGIPDFSQGE